MRIPKSFPAAIDHWGIESGLRRLRGMFAFALYDQQEDRLLLARDPFGIKPLYIGQAPGLILFASEPKALFTYPRLQRQADAVALLDFFSLGAPLSPRTCWSTVRELEPGTWRQYSRQAEHYGRFWDWEAAAVEPLTEAEGLERLETVLCEALQLHLESDVPLAAFLSGGIDSSLVVALLCKHFMPGLPTFHMGFDEVAYDESRHARAVAQHCGSQHHESRMAAGEGTPELFQRIVAHYDQPFGDSSCLPTWLICQEMARHTKVVISGDGGDEMFGGYDRYLQARQLTTLARRPMLRWLATAGGRLLTMTHPDLARKLYKASTLARLPRQPMLCGLLTYFTLADARALFQPDFLRLALAEGETAERFARYIPTELADPLAQLMAAESRSLLHYDFLRKVDVASSAHGLEVRTPFVDVEVFNFAMRLPMTLKVRPGSLKVLPRLLARRLLPASVIDRPKQGFAIPFDRWAGPKLREFLHDLLLSPTARCRDWLRPERVEAILQVFANNYAAGLSQSLSGLTPRVFTGGVRVVAAPMVAICALVPQGEWQRRALNRMAITLGTKTSWLKHRLQRWDQQRYYRAWPRWAVAWHSIAHFAAVIGVYGSNHTVIPMVPGRCLP